MPQRHTFVPLSMMKCHSPSICMTCPRVECRYKCMYVNMYLDRHKDTFVSAACYKHYKSDKGEERERGGIGWWSSMAFGLLSVWSVLKANVNASTTISRSHHKLAAARQQTWPKTRKKIKRCSIRFDSLRFMFCIQL